MLKLSGSTLRENMKNMKTRWQLFKTNISTNTKQNSFDQNEKIKNNMKTRWHSFKIDSSVNQKQKSSKKTLGIH